MSLSIRILVLSAFVAMSASVSNADDPATESKPVVITSADLSQLSLSTRQELEALIEQKKGQPQPKDLNIKVGQQGAIFEGDITPGRTEIRVLGRTIRVSNQRKRAQPIAIYDENAPIIAPLPAGEEFPEDMTITIRKSGNQPMSINIVKGDVDVTISGEKLDELVEQYRPYVQQMLEKGLSGVSPPPAPGDTSPDVDLGNPASELGEPAESLDDVVPELPKTP